MINKYQQIVILDLPICKVAPGWSLIDIVSPSGTIAHVLINRGDVKIAIKDFVHHNRNVKVLIDAVN